jgi:hypothetical protein
VAVPKPRFFPLGCIFFLPTIVSVVTATLPYIESLAGCRLRNGDGDTVTTTDGSAAAARDGLGSTILPSRLMKLILTAGLDHKWLS